MSPRNLQLLVVDPQNDFMDRPGAALPVTGAMADMARLAGVIDAARAKISGITVTLDSHHSVGIERPAFWQQADGSDVVPFTQVSAEQVRCGEYVPRGEGHRQRALAYLDALEAQGRYRLMIWPVHCEIGTWGHNVQEDLRAAYNRWERASLQPVRKVFKGMNAWTEMYSALQAEVPDPQDPETDLNRRLVARLDEADLLVIAGEASSHCVRATTEHLVQSLPSGRVEKVMLLADCMSPVTGFESQAQEFLRGMAARGVRVGTSADLLAGLGN